MENEKSIVKRNPPKLDDLYGDKVNLGEFNEWNILLNHEPKKAWLREHPFVQVDRINEEGKKVKVPLLYIPIEITEYLLTYLFVKWRIEVKEVKMIANAIITTVRLHYMNPVSGEWDWHDGIGACNIQVYKGEAASDFEKIRPDAVQKAAPASKSYAIKDAADHIGKLFGKDINRVGQADYEGLENKFESKTGLINKISDSLIKLKGESKKNFIQLINDAEDNGSADYTFYKETLEAIEKVLNS